MSSIDVGPEHYYSYSKEREQAVQKISSDERYESISQRKDTSVYNVDTIVNMCHGKYLTDWKGVELCKSPLDIIIYQAVMWEVKPGTVFELGAYKGGAAMWMSDILKVWGIPAPVYSIDLDLKLLDDKAKEDKNIKFLEGNVEEIDKVLPPELLMKCPHPWVIIEDVHVNTHGIMEYFHKFLETGDYYIMDDTNPVTPANTGAGLTEEYQRWGSGKLNTIRNFLLQHESDYAIDTKFTDMFGYNGTWNMNGYIRKM